MSTHDRKGRVWLRIQGGTLKIWEHLDDDLNDDDLDDDPEMVEARRKLRKALRKTPHVMCGKHGPAPIEKLSEYGLAVRRNSLICRLMQRLHTIKNRYKCFLSLILDHKVHPDISVYDFKAGITRFFRKLREEYLRLWFVYKIEFSHESKLHLHMVGALSPTPGNISYHIGDEKIVKSIWDECFCQNKSRLQTVRISRFVDKHLSYMTTRKKFRDDINCMKRLRGLRMYGVIGRDRIIDEDIVQKCISGRQFDEIMQFITEKHEGTHNTDYFALQAKHKRGAIRGLNRKVLAEVIKAINESGGD